MNESARVRFVGTLEELRGALTVFADKSALALECMDAELRRTQEWLERQLAHWQAEIRQCEEAAFLAKQELARKRMMKFDDQPVDTWEQEQALRRAKRRLEVAEDKQEVTRNWLRQWASELLEYEGPARLLKSYLEADVVRACALLMRKLETLEAYLAVSPPSEAPTSIAADGTRGQVAPAGRKAP